MPQELLPPPAATVTIHVGALGFPAIAPTRRSADNGHYFRAANEAWQAGMAVRALGLLHCLGAGSVGYFTYLLSLANPRWLTGWNQHHGMGLRNDTTTGTAPFVRGDWAYRRPIWFAVRRLVWLVSQSSDAEVLYAERGAIVLQFTARSGFGMFDKSWKYLTIAWVDQYAMNEKAVYDENNPDTRSGGIYLTFPGSSHDLVDLVPVVTPLAVLDSLGYQDASEAWGAVSMSGSVVTGIGNLRALISPTDPVSTPAPFAIYPNAPCSSVEDE